MPDLKLQFEALSRIPEEEKRIVKAVREGMIFKREANRRASVQAKKKTASKKAVAYGSR